MTHIQLLCQQKYKGTYVTIALSKETQKQHQEEDYNTCSVLYLLKRTPHLQKSLIEHR